MPISMPPNKFPHIMRASPEIEIIMTNQDTGNIIGSKKCKIPIFANL